MARRTLTQAPTTASHRQYRRIAWVGVRLQAWLHRHPYLSAYLLGAIYFLLIFSWMIGIRTADIITGAMAKVVVASAGFVTVSSLALGFVLFVWMKRRLGLRFIERRAVWLIPALWVVSEYLRAVIFSIISLGPDGRIGPYWAFGHLGFFLSDTPLAYAARFGGVYLLSFLCAALGVATYQCWQGRRVRPLIIVVSLTLGLSLAGWLIYRSPQGQTVSVGAVEYAQRDTPYRSAADSYSVLQSGPKKSLDTLVLPEYSHYFDDPNYAAADAAVLTDLMKTDEGLIVHSRHQNLAARGYNLLTFQTSRGRLLNEQPKWFVVPAGEYVPYLYQVVLAYAGQGRLLLDFNQQKSVERGNLPERPFTYQAVRYGAYACSGVLSPDFYNRLVQQGTDIFTNSAALDTLGVSPLFHYEALQMNRLAAIAHAKPFVQSAKGGPAYILDKDGRMQAYAGSGRGAVVSAVVQTNTRTTLYGYAGDWIIYTSGLVIVGLFVWQRWSFARVFLTSLFSSGIFKHK